LSQHVHMIADFSGASVEHHSGGLQYFEFLLDTNGDVVQFMGPAPHSAVPTTAPSSISDPSCQGNYVYKRSTVGYPTSLGYRDIVLLHNGAQPNNFVVWEDYLELPVGTTGNYFSQARCLAAVPPYGYAVVDIPNTIVQWAHHSQAWINSSSDDFSSTHLYVDDFGQIYGSEASGPYGTVGTNPGQEIFMGNALNLSPADTATNVSRQPTFSWSPPDPATYPTGITSVGNYLVSVSSTLASADPSQTAIVASISVDPAACTPNCSLPWPSVLAPSTLYYWRVTDNGVGPISPGAATGSNAGLPGIGGGAWLGGGVAALSFTTGP
jgi:hypothetical protein